jgi:hypothetical protein
LYRKVFAQTIIFQKTITIIVFYIYIFGRSDTELSQIIRNAFLTGWKKAQVQANLHHLSLAAQTRYDTGLKSEEPIDPVPHRDKLSDSKVSNLRTNQNFQLNVKSKNKANPETG